MDRGVFAGRGLAAAEAFDDPDRLDAGFGGSHFGDGALPLGSNLVAIVAGAVDAFGGEFRRGHGRVFGELAVFFEQRVDFIFDFFFALGVENFFGGEEFFVKGDGIALFPILALLGRNVLGGVVLGVAAAAGRFCFDEDWALAGTGAIDRVPGGCGDRDSVVFLH